MDWQEGTISVVCHTSFGYAMLLQAFQQLPCYQLVLLDANVLRVCVRNCLAWLVMPLTCMVGFCRRAQDGDAIRATVPAEVQPTSDHAHLSCAGGWRKRSVRAVIPL